MNNMNVIGLPASRHFKPLQALQSCADFGERLTDVLVIGYDDDGEIIIRSSHMTRGEALFMIEKARAWAITGGQE